MKKTIILLFVLSGLHITVFAQYNDALKRSAGVYFSPAITNIHIRGVDEQSSAQFGFTLGFRRAHQICGGFFIESGFRMSLTSALLPEEEYIWYTYSDFYPYTTTAHIGTMQSKEQYWGWSTPFLAGYKTRKGAVRFVGAAGISFNLTMVRFDRTTYSGDLPPDDYYGYSGPFQNVHGSFGTSFSAIACAGISVPFGKRISFEALPSFRYDFLYFQPESWDMIESAKTDAQRWLLGLDIGFMWKLDDAGSEYDKAELEKIDESFTYQYGTDSASKPVVEEEGYRNYIYFEALGNGIVYSINYERNILQRNQLGLNAKGGFGLMGMRDWQGYGTIMKLGYFIPVGVNLAIGRRNKFEAGFGATFENILLKEFNYDLVPSIAYRRECASHFFFRAAFTPRYVVGTGELMPGFGISLGGAF